MVQSDPLSGLPDQKTGGGHSVMVRGFPCLHLHYFTPTSAANFLLISTAEFLHTPTPAEVSLYVCVCTSQTLCTVSACGFKETFLVKTTDTANPGKNIKL